MFSCLKCNPTGKPSQYGDYILPNGQNKMSIEITEKKKRSVLNEGRDNGMAFGFLQQVEDDTFHTVQPLSPCKDYLAEVVFTEKYDIPTRGCGLSYPKKLNIFSNCAYMAVKIMPVCGSSCYNYSKSIANDIKLLEENFQHVERLLNNFEKQLGMKVLTTVAPANGGYFLVRFSSDWCESTHSISLYSLLLRVLMVATDSDKDIMSFLKDYSYHRGDKDLISSCMAKIELILKTKKLPPNTRKYSKATMLKLMGSPHDNGIVAWNSSFEEVPLEA